MLVLALSSSTFAALLALLLGTALVGFNTWRNGRATGSVGQLIHETDKRDVPRA